MSYDVEKVSYILGQQIGNDFRSQGVEVNADTLTKSLVSALNGEPSIMSQEEIQGTMMAFQTYMQQKMMEKQAEAAKGNKEEGEKFLAENKAGEGVVTLDSGLQYKVLSEGTGEKPAADATIEAHYEGRLIDGTVFDSSIQRGEPATFPVNRVIAGWTEALQLMPVGSKWQLFIPSELAYGDQGAPPAIGPGATLIFDVELLAIK